MKRFLLLISIVGSLAQAQAPSYTTVEVTEAPSLWQLRDGQSHPTGATFESKQACIDAAKALATAAATLYRCTYAAPLEVKSVCIPDPPPLPNDGSRVLWGEQDPADDTKWHLFETGWISAPWPECWKWGPVAIHVPELMIDSGDTYVPPLDRGALDGEHP